MTEKDDKYSFETYWDEREKELRNYFRRSPGEFYIHFMKKEAEKAWNHSKAMANEEILETNVVINRGIWESLTKHLQKKSDTNG